MIVRLMDTGGIPRVITPNDDRLVLNCKAIYSNAGGNVSLQYGSETPVLIALPAGLIFPLIPPFIVRQSGTTAQVIGLFDQP